MTAQAHDPEPASDLSNEQWQLVAHLFDNARARGGRVPLHSRRRILGAILHVLDTDCSWRHLPTQFPPWRTVYGYYRQWDADGTLLQVSTALNRSVGPATSKGSARVDTLGEGPVEMTSA